jgi:hypothetical protein
MTYERFIVSFAVGGEAGGELLRGSPPLYPSRPVTHPGGPLI